LGQKMTQVIRHVLRGHVAIGSSLGDCLETNSLDLLGYVLVNLTKRARVKRSDLLKQFALGFSSKRPSSCKQLVKDHAEAEDVGSAVDSMTFPASLLRTHVTRRPRKLRPLAEVFLAECQAEVGNIGLIFSIEQDVPRLDIPVDEALAMGIMKRLRQRR